MKNVIFQSMTAAGFENPRPEEIKKVHPVKLSGQLVEAISLKLQ